jgi:GTPase SAR1 family protein
MSSERYNPHQFSECDDAYRILVLGERGVGKTAFIDALYNCVCPLGPSSAIPPPPNLELPYKPTTNIYSKYIPATRSEYLPRTTMANDVRANRFSKSFLNFALNQHGKQQIDTVIPDAVFNSQIPPNRVFQEILISEIPVCREESIEHLAQEFDKIIIMADYSDINSMRCLQYWSEKIKSSRRKIIICVSKCDCGSDVNYIKCDFQLRKAQIMDHFLRQCAVEYISVKTGANIGFIYKYI